MLLSALYLSRESTCCAKMWHFGLILSTVLFTWWSLVVCGLLVQPPVSKKIKKDQKRSSSIRIPIMGFSPTHYSPFFKGDFQPSKPSWDLLPNRRINLIDFGCCRPFKVAGYWVYPRKAHAVGTTRFCAVPAHHGERSPRCDLESFCYVAWTKGKSTGWLGWYQQLCCHSFGSNLD